MRGLVFQRDERKLIAVGAVPGFLVSELQLLVMLYHQAIVADCGKGEVCRCIHRGPTSRPPMPTGYIEQAWPGWSETESGNCPGCNRCAR